jgi:hypothetical protein
MAALLVWRRPRKVPLRWDGPKRSPAVRLPSARETAESIGRFREAAARGELVDFVWERYARGRGLFI